MYLSKEATNKDQSLKLQMMLSLDKEDTSNNSEKIRKKIASLETKKEILQSKKLIFLKIRYYIAIRALSQL